MSYGKGNDGRIVIRLCCPSSKSFGRNPLTIYETGFVAVTSRLGLFHDSCLHAGAAAPGGAAPPRHLEV